MRDGQVNLRDAAEGQILQFRGLGDVQGIGGEVLDVEQPDDARLAWMQEDVARALQVAERVLARAGEVYLVIAIAAIQRDGRIEMVVVFQRLDFSVERQG